MRPAGTSSSEDEDDEEEEEDSDRVVLCATGADAPVTLLRATLELVVAAGRSDPGRGESRARLAPWGRAAPREVVEWEREDEPSLCVALLPRPLSRLASMSWSLFRIAPLSRPLSEKLALLSCLLSRLALPSRSLSLATLPSRPLF